MMRLLKDLKSAQKYLPSVVQNGKDIDISDMYQMAEDQLVEDILGDDLYGELGERSQENEKLGIMCERIIALNGFLAAIPDIDLVLTQSGFAVTSDNDGYVPASTARVKALIASLTERADKATDTLIRFLMTSSQYESAWRSSNQFDNITSGLIACYSEFKDYAPYSPAVSAVYPKSYSEFKKYYSALSIALMTEVASYLSVDYCNELLEKYRDNVILSQHEKYVLTQIKHALCAIVMGDQLAGRNFTFKARSYMLKFPAYFLTFFESPEAKTIDITHSDSGIFSTL